MTVFLSLAMSVKNGALFASILFLSYNVKMFISKDSKIKIFFFISLLLSIGLLIGDFFIPCGKPMIITTIFGSMIVVLLNLYIIFCCNNLNFTDLKNKFFSGNFRNTETENDSGVVEKKGGAKPKENNFNYRE